MELKMACLKTMQADGYRYSFHLLNCLLQLLRNSKVPLDFYCLLLWYKSLFNVLEIVYDLNSVAWYALCHLKRISRCILKAR